MRSSFTPGRGMLVLISCAQFGEALPGAGGHDDGAGFALAQPLDDEGIGGVGLVQHDDLGDLAGVDLGQHGADRGDLPLGIGVGGVDDVEDEVGVGDLLQGRTERLDQLGGQRPDEPDGVGEGVADAVRRSPPCGPWDPASRTARSRRAPRRR